MLQTLLNQSTILNSQVDAATKLIEVTDHRKVSQMVAHSKVPDPTGRNNEYLARQRRKCNLIVRNVPESPKQVKSEQIEEYTAQLSDLFHKELGIVRVQIKKITRLGKCAHDQTHLILITVCVEDVKNEFCIMLPS